MISNRKKIIFVEKGFKEGDKIKLTTSGGVSKVHIITSFTSNNTVLGLAVTGTDTDDDALADSTSTFTITLESEELIAVLQDRGITTTSTAESNPNFLHRKVDGFAYLCIKIERKKLATILNVLPSFS